jgi:hypothetical protein
MKILIFPSILIAVLLSLNTQAQVQAANQKVAAVAKNVQPKQTISSASDSLKLALDEAKSSFNTLFKPHLDTTTIMITNIDYEDSNLTVLKENLKKIKGVKAVSMQYKSSNVFLRVPYKGKPTDLWDKLPPASKSPFKMVEANDNSILLKFKNEKSLN